MSARARDIDIEETSLRLIMYKTEYVVLTQASTFSTVYQRNASEMNDLHPSKRPSANRSSNDHGGFDKYR